MLKGFVVILTAKRRWGQPSWLVWGEKDMIVKRQGGGGGKWGHGMTRPTGEKNCYLQRKTRREKKQSYGKKSTPKKTT